MVISVMYRDCVLNVMVHFSLKFSYFLFVRHHIFHILSVRLSLDFRFSGDIFQEGIVVLSRGDE